MRRAGLFLLLLLLPVHADEVVLESGGRLSCEVLEVTESHVRVRLPHGVMVLPRGKVVEIVREDSGAYLAREARRSLRAGDTRGAAELRERAYRQSPSKTRLNAWVDALEHHARKLVKQFRLAEATAVLARLSKAEPGHAAVAELARTVAQERARATRLVQQAQAHVDRGEFDRALKYLDAWRLRLPPDDPGAREAMAKTHLGAASQAARQSHLRLALDHLRAARTYGAYGDTREPLRMLQPVAVLEAMREGDLEEAARLLDGIGQTYPDPAVPVFLQAVLHHVRGEVDEAVAAYADAARRAGRKPEKGLDYELVRHYATATLRAAIARPPAEGVSKWRELFLGSLRRHDRSPHFIVYASTDAEAAAVAARADLIYEQIAGDLLGRVPGAAKAEIVIHPTRQAYLAADPDPPGSPVREATMTREHTGGVCYDTLDEGGRPLVRVETWTNSSLLEATLPHEVTHVVQRRGLRVFRRGKWLDEGLAMLYESKDSRQSRLALWRQQARSGIPLPELVAMRSVPPDKVSLFYNESYAFTAFLRNLGDEQQWLDFLDAYATGTFEQAAKRAWKIESFAALERRWASG